LKVNPMTKVASKHDRAAQREQHEAAAIAFLARLSPTEMVAAAKANGTFEALRAAVAAEGVQVHVTVEKDPTRAARSRTMQEGDRTMYPIEVEDDDTITVTIVDEAAAYAHYRKQWVGLGFDLQRLGGKYCVLRTRGKVLVGGTLQECIDGVDEEMEAWNAAPQKIKEALIASGSRVK
jgi:hypothetical protein